MLPHDLDNDEICGKQHIRVLQGLKTHTNGLSTFVKLVVPFLQVISHQSSLDCLSVDTAVGCLYSFFGGSNGTRAIPFFQCCLANLLESKLESILLGADFEKAFINMLTALRELLR
jgi:hypothetical protein